MVSETDKLLKKHEKLNQLDDAKVISHVQRKQDDWILNTLLLDGHEVPFRYRRRKRYKSLEGARVNLTYYPEVTEVGGIALETMKIVRVRRA